MRIADGVDYGVCQVTEVVGNEVGQGRVLGMAPSRLDGVQVGSVGRQPLDREPVRAAGPQAFDRRAVHAPAIEHDDQRSAMLTVQGVKVAHHILGADVVDVHAKRQPYATSIRRDRQAADHTQAVVMACY